MQKSRVRKRFCIIQRKLSSFIIFVNTTTFLSNERKIVKYFCNKSHSKHCSCTYSAVGFGFSVMKPWKPCVISLHRLQLTVSLLWSITNLFPTLLFSKLTSQRQPLVRYIQHRYWFFSVSQLIYFFAFSEIFMKYNLIYFPSRVIRF